MRDRVKILVFVLLLGVMWVTGLTKSDAPTDYLPQSTCIADYAQADCVEEYLHDANDNSQPHLASRRRTNSSSQSQTLKKSQRRTTHTRIPYSTLADNSAEVCGTGLSYISNGEHYPLISHHGSTLVIRLHQFRI